MPVLPTYDDLLCKGYIKAAHALKELFYKQLIAIFGAKKIKIAPIKELQRCKSKLDEYKTQKDNSPPYSAYLCDYLRASVLCQTLEEVIISLEQLCAGFRVVRVKERLDPNTHGNKVILVNLIVEDKEDSIKPHRYTWSRWWDNQRVRMIAEVTSPHHFYVSHFLLA